MAGRDLMVVAETGTGKTAAFLLPIINKLIYSIGDTRVYPATPQVLIITPTTLEALQIYNEIKKFTKGSSIIAHWWLMENNVFHILIVTPRMLMDHAKKCTVKFSRLKFLVLDEADTVIDLLEYGHGLLAWIEETMLNSNGRQTLMFSTRFSDNNQVLAQEYYLKDYLFLGVGILNIKDSDLSIKELRQRRARQVIRDDNMSNNIKYTHWFDESGLKPSLLRDLTVAGYAIPTVIHSFFFIRTIL